MSDNETNDRWEEIREIWQDPDNRFFYRMLGGFVLVGLGVWIGWQLFAEDHLGYASDVFTTIWSIVVTVLIIDALNRRRDERTEKKRLIRQMRSRVNDIAIAAIEELSESNALFDGS